MQRPSFWRFTALAGACCVINLLAADQASAQARSSGKVQFQHSRGPTVSRYTALINNGNGGGAQSYYNIVQPQKRQQQIQRSLANEIKSVDSRFQTLQAPQNIQSGGGAQQSAEAAISSGRLMPTGHKPSFGNLGGYFPGGPR